VSVALAYSHVKFASEVTLLF